MYLLRQVKVSVEILPYEEKEHRELIRLWLKNRKLDTALLEDLPELGFVALRNHVPIAAAFIRKCEGRIAIFDSLITNPAITLFTRHCAIEKLIERTILVAKTLGYYRILALSVDEGTIRRAKLHGFVKLHSSAMSLSVDH